MNTNTDPVRALIDHINQNVGVWKRENGAMVALHLRDRLETALAQQTAAPVLAKHQPCGCVICTCEDEQQCQGCGAKHCGNRADHPPYVAQQPAAPGGAVNVVGMPEFDDLLDYIYEHGTAAEGVIERANAFARAVLAQYTPQQPAAPSGEAGQWVECCPALLIAGVSCARTPRREGSDGRSHEHFIAHAAPQQPAGVDEAMVERAVAAVMSAPTGISVEAYVRIVLEAATSAQQQGGRADG